MKHLKTFGLLVVFCVFLTGCGINKSLPINSLKIDLALEPIKIDGKLDEIQWQKSKTYSLMLSSDKASALEDSASVKFLYDRENLYIALVFDDKDIVAEGAKDNDMHYRLGDVCEIFLKPKNKNYYWEIYTTPGGNKSFFFIKGRGRLGIPSCYEGFDNAMEFKSSIVGTLNDFKDEDKQWVCEIMIPRKMVMTQFGLSDLEISSGWKILIARYNYSFYLPNKELSMFPQLSQTNYHLHEEYITIMLKDKK